MLVTKDDLEFQASGLSPSPEDMDLTTWASRVEDTVDKAIQHLHDMDPALHPTQCLPKKFRGRCTPKKIVQVPLTTPCRRGRNGDYQPPGECISFQSKRLVKQLRRILSLKQRLLKVHQFQTVWSKTWYELQQEWDAIRKSFVHDQPFVHWANKIPELSPCPRYLPDASWLHEAAQFLRHACDSQIAYEAKVLQRCATMRHITDCQDGHKVKTFAQVRGRKQGSFRTCDSTVQETGIAVHLDEPLRYQIYVDKPQQFTFPDKIFVNTQSGHIINFDENSLVVQLDNPLTEEEEEVNVVQTQCHFDIQSVFQKLTSYWMQFWQSQNDVDTSVESEMQAAFDAIPPMETMTERPDLDAKEWKQAIDSTKTFSSPGIDGFSFAELKQIPMPLLQELASVISRMQSFPQWLMFSKTIPLPKVQSNPLPSQSRPITVLSSLYRLWSKITGRAILRLLASKLPPEITGLLPGRGAFQAAYHQQVILEKAKLDIVPLTGMTLDLQKCFNLIGREQVKLLMLKHGLNPQLVHKWFASLQELSRYWVIENEVSLAMPSNVGCPEGDTWSVLAMVLINSTWIHRLKALINQIGASAFADNWSWWIPTQCNPIPALRFTKSLCWWLGLNID